MVRPAALADGSPAPGSHDEVESLLRLVHFVAFEPEFERCVGESERHDPDGFEDFVNGVRGDVSNGLAALEHRASEANNGGLAFLAGTLTHFLSREPVSIREHPLLVALYLRTRARAEGLVDEPAPIGQRMNDW